MVKAVEKTETKRKGKSSTSQTSPIPTAELDRLIHDRIRLGMLSALAAEARLSFNELKRVLKASDGNLSVHARKLEDAGYISCRKTFEGRMPRTDYRLTAKGRKALESYVAHMEAIISHVKGG